MWRDLKYLLAYIVPAVVVHALYCRGIWSYNGLTVAFIIIPILEFFFPGNTNNLDQKEEQQQLSKVIFDVLLYLNVPMLLGIAYWYFYTIAYPLAPLRNRRFDTHGRHLLRRRGHKCCPRTRASNGELTKVSIQNIIDSKSIHAFCYRTQLWASCTYCDS